MLTKFLNNDRSGQDDDGSAHANRREFMREAMAATGLLSLSPGASTCAQSRIGSKEGPQPKVLPSASEMAATTETFLSALNSEQQSKVKYEFEDEQRFDFHFIPRSRKGIPLKELDTSQRHLAYALLSAGLSQRGFTKVVTIMSLETILAEIEQNRGPVRDPELYYFSVFGKPRSQKPWGWRLEGHHLSLNYSIVNNEQIAVTPSFLGSNPAEVLHGPRKGLRVLAAEEEVARTLLKSLDDKQRTQAVISNNAPKDILSGNLRKAQPLNPAGIPASKLSQRQADILMSLLKEYASNMPPDIAAIRLEKLRSAGFGNIFFAWAGGPGAGEAHYYRIQGPTFLIEYDNIQNDANHIHTVWRDFNGDFGLDLLAKHHKEAHH